jgi:hypothetical protein
MFVCLVARMEVMQNLAYVRGDFRDYTRSVRGLSDWVFSHAVLRSLPRTEIHVGLNVNYQLLLFDFNLNWNMSIKFSKTPQYKIS